MKNLLIIIFSALLLSCSDTVENSQKSSGYIADGQKVMIGSDETVEIFKQIDNAWFERDYDAIRELVAEDARLVFANGDIGQGPEDLIEVIEREYQQSTENDESWGWDSYAFSVKVTPTEANRGNETGEWVLAEFWTEESQVIEWYQISEGKLISWNQFRRNRQ
jgi:hypothetical protein|tara:strand:+ start:227 stop:718 length:492 start_codon:yes stop_codon:yes gene_type:complete